MDWLRIAKNGIPNSALYITSFFFLLSRRPWIGFPLFFCVTGAMNKNRILPYKLCPGTVTGTKKREQVGSLRAIVYSVATVTGTHIRTVRTSIVSVQLILAFYMIWKRNYVQIIVFLFILFHNYVILSYSPSLWKVCEKVATYKHTKH